MKQKMLVYLVAVLVAFSSCSDDKEVKKKGTDPDVTHAGDKWNVTAAEYNLIDQSTTGQTFKSGTSATGFFHFDVANSKGSFELDLEGFHKEDLFAFQKNSKGSWNITAIEQSVSGTIGQNVVAFSGENDSDSQITLSGTITKQSTAGQFILTITVTLVKA